MLKEIFKGAFFKKVLAFGTRHKRFGLGGLLAALGFKNRHRIRGLLSKRGSAT